MNNAIMSKEKWVTIFRAIGMDDAKMNEWHQEFEKQFPLGHQAFLEWLNIPEAQIKNIRTL